MHSHVTPHAQVSAHSDQPTVQADDLPGACLVKMWVRESLGTEGGHMALPFWAVASGSDGGRPPGTGCGGVPASS